MVKQWWVPAALFASAFAFVGGAILAQESDDPKPEAEAETTEEIRQAPKPADPRLYRIGQMLEDVAFTDMAGKQGKLSEYKGKVLVIAVTNVGCPICKKFAPTLNEIHAAYAEKGVEFILLNPMANDSTEKINDAIQRYGFKARYVHDPKQTLASALAVNSTGDCFVIDGARTLRYRGAVDDQYGFGYTLDAPRRNYLKDALDAVLAGREVYEKATWAPGCEIKLEATKPTGDITWHNRISRIFADNCQDCHRAGENGPFELMTFADAKDNSAMIKRQVRNKLMPPWFASKQHGDWANDASLSDADREAVITWVDNGCPEGDAKDAPLPRSFTSGWRIPEPTHVVKLPEPYKVPAKGKVPYIYVDVGTDYGEDKWVQSMEIRNSQPQVVHHVLIFLEYPRNHPRANEQPQDRGGLTGYFMGMVPGMGHIVFPKGFGKFLPKGARMHFQVHYTPNGEAVDNMVSLGMNFCEGKPEKEVVTTGISNVLFEIPPGADNHEVKAIHRTKKKMRLLSLMPHMHVRGKAYRYVAELPDGKEITLLDIPAYDFNWQLVYILREPIDLPAGTKITATGWFDNSDKNPANPDPKAKVRFGEQTWEEMQIGYVNWYELD